VSFSFLKRKLKEDFVSFCQIINLKPVKEEINKMPDDVKLTPKEKLDIVVESALQLIPWIGGPLATAYFGTKNEKRFKRIENFYEELSLQIQEKGIQFNSIEAHDEDALIAVIEKLNEKVEQEVLNEKRNYFKNFLMNSLIEPTKKYNYDERRFFLDVLADMTLLEIQLIVELSKVKSPALVKSIAEPGIAQSKIVGAVGRLKNYGFIDAFTQGLTIGGQVNNMLNESIILNEFGIRFFNFCLSDEW